MAKKLKFSNDSPVTVTFVLLSAAVFMIDHFASKLGLVHNYFTCPGSSLSAVPFDFTKPLDYIKILVYALGNSSWSSFFVNSAFLLMLGPVMEERYGSFMVALMGAVSILVTGVVNVSLVPVTMTGAACLVLMMIFLSAINNITKKSLSLSWLLLFVLYLGYKIYSCTTGSEIPSKLLNSNSFISFLQKNVPLLTAVIGGLAGGAFGFLKAPKKKASAAVSKKRDNSSWDSVSSGSSGDGFTPVSKEDFD